MLTILPKSFSMLREPRYILQLKKDQYKKIEELEKIQSKRLRNIVRHAYSHVPYYHSLFKKMGIRPSDIKTVADLTKLPTVSKADFLQNWSSFISNTANPERCMIVSTSGTTGTPVKILKDPVTADVDSALVYYAFFECGMSLKDIFLELTATFPSFSKCTFRHGPGNLMRSHYLSVFNDPSENVEAILRINPDIICSYSSALECIVEDFESKMRKLNLKIVFTQAEMLTEKRRSLIKNCLQINPHDTYGSREFARIAFECSEHQGLHVITDWMIMELLKDGENVGSNERGETIVTGLYNYTMPLIRYELGDMARSGDEKCSCGRNWPLLKSIEGRTMHVATLPSGRKIVFGDAIWPLIRTIEGLKRFQMVFQQSERNVIVRVVCEKNISERKRDLIQQQIINKLKIAFLNEDLNTRVRFVNAILPQKSGKIPDFILEG